MLYLSAFLFFLLIGMPLAFTLLAVGLGYFLLAEQLPMVVAVQRMVAASQSFPLLAVPFFIVAGHVMNMSGITQRLVHFANLLVCWIAGGLAHVTIVLSALMGGVSGSAIADAAMQARVLGEPMVKSGLPQGFSAAAICISALITACIPPSIGLILYGYVGNVSIGQLFLAGIVPGILLTFTLMLVVYLTAKFKFTELDKKHNHKPKLAEILAAGKACIWALLFPVILIVTIRFGIFTPSEAGAFAVVYAALVGRFVYHELSFSKLLQAFVDSINDIGMVMLIILASGIIGYLIAYEQLPVSMAQGIQGISQNPLLVLLICLLFLLCVGMLMEGTVTVLLLTPILVPVVQSVGIDPVHFGVLMMIVVTFGGTTPPVGVAMYTVCNIMQCPLDKFLRDAMPFYLAVVVLVVLLALFPTIVMFLPNLVF
ncbi:TRAP transporter large permease (plasmid) [Catenovulum sp. SX2]|uniref:TRAP transporter large permease n=1 Tax=Catenovulum sp. SX2 TaxID=3398614 RepID=UPI003F865D95